MDHLPAPGGICLLYSGVKMSCGLRRLMRLPSRSSMSTLMKWAHSSTGPESSGFLSAPLRPAPAAGAGL